MNSKDITIVLTTCARSASMNRKFLSPMPFDFSTPHRRFLASPGFLCILPCHHPNAQNWITSTASKLRRVKNCVSHVGWGLSKRGSASPKVFKLAAFFFWLFFVFLFLFYPQQVIFGNPEKNIPGWITKKSTPFAKIANVKNDLVKNWPGCLVTWS